MHRGGQKRKIGVMCGSHVRCGGAPLTKPRFGCRHVTLLASKIDLFSEVGAASRSRGGGRRANIRFTAQSSVHCSALRFVGGSRRFGEAK